MKWKKLLLAVVIITVVIILFSGLFSFLGIFIDTPWEEMKATIIKAVEAYQK